MAQYMAFHRLYIGYLPLKMVNTIQARWLANHSFST